jgi:hypothetical protein
MPNIKGSRRQQLEWIEARLGAWEADPAAVGLRPQQVAMLRARAASTRAAMVHTNTMHAEAKSATRAFHDQSALLTTIARDLVAAVKAFARASGDPDVYVRSNVAPAAAPAPAPAPTAPINVTAHISATGAVTLSWDAPASGATSGVFFLVERAHATRGNAPFTLIGATADRALTDPAPRLADGPVLYRLRAVRGEQMSDWTTPIVFDIRGGAGAAMKMAA